MPPRIGGPVTAPPTPAPTRLRVGELGVGRGSRPAARRGCPRPTTRPSSRTTIWSACGDRRNPLRHNDDGRRRPTPRAARRGPGRRCARRARRTRRRTGRSPGRRITARAIASRCRWPPEKLMPPWATRISRPSGWARDEVVGRGHPQRRPHLVVGRVGLAVAQVVGDGAGEQVAALGHQARSPTTAPRCRSRARRCRRRAPRRRSRRTAGRSATTSVDLPDPVQPTIAVVVPGARSAKHPAAQDVRRPDS